MSGKREKAIRKLAKEELQKRMDQPQPQNQTALQILQYLEQFIQLCLVLTGEKPSSITLTEVMYNAYIQESQRHAEVLGLKTGFKTDEPVFNGVKLVRKSPIEVPQGANVPEKSAIELPTK